MANLQIFIKNCKVEISNERIFSTANFVFDDNEQRNEFLYKIAHDFMIEE